jgi:hypothetical protein
MKTHTDKEVVELFNEYNNKYSVSNLDNHRIPRFLKEKGLVEELEVGTWYKSHINELFCIIHHESDTWYNCYGFTSCGMFYNNRTRNLDTHRKLIKATPQEVEQALIKEAKKRGFKEGVSCYWDDENVTHDDMSGVIIYRHESNYLTMNGDIFYEDGKWADLVEEKKECNCKRFNLIGNLQDTFCGYCTEDSQYEEVEEKEEEINLRKLDDNEVKLVNQLFMGKVSDMIGIDKTLDLVRECKRDLK